MPGHNEKELVSSVPQPNQSDQPDMPQSVERKEVRAESQETKETSTKQNTLESFSFVRTIVKKFEKSEEEKKKQVKENKKQVKEKKKISERKTSLSTPKKAKISCGTRPHCPKISTPDNVTNKGRGGGLKLKESNKKKVSLIKTYFEPLKPGKITSGESEFDKVADFQTKCEIFSSMFTVKRQDQVVTGKLAQKVKDHLPNFEANEHQPIAAQHMSEDLEVNKNLTNKMAGRRTSEGQDELNSDPPSLAEGKNKKKQVVG